MLSKLIRCPHLSHPVTMRGHPHLNWVYCSFSGDTINTHNQALLFLESSRTKKETEWREHVWMGYPAGIRNCLHVGVVSERWILLFLNCEKKHCKCSALISPHLLTFSLLEKGELHFLVLYVIWVIPCQLIHFFADPSPILMKFGKLGGQQKKQIHTKFQLISTIFNGVRAL